MTGLAAPGFKRVVEIPKGTSELAWEVAAAWSDVPVATLLADTAPVKSAHYMAALKVVHVVECWLLDQNAEGDEDSAAALRAERLSAEDDPLAEVIIRDDEEDHFARALRLAEDVAALTAGARDSGDAITAAKYSSFENSLLQAAAGLQALNDIEIEEK
ncbi:hypothetical protein [Specibacter sp. NPDC078692]|uniref:hypothetical protein n=1 Tax=Specibacter sp. NPDC078692 TaxID=3155818 RepID=UPI00342AAE55